MSGVSSDDQLYKETLNLYRDPVFAKKYASSIDERVAEWLFDEFLQYIPLPAQILDIACAAGRDSAYLQNKGYKVTGIDYSDKLVNIAKQKYPNIDFFIGDFTELPFDDDFFNAIWCKAAIVHLPSQKVLKKALKEFYRVLKYGGYTMILTKAKGKHEPRTVVREDKLSGKKRYFRFQDKKELGNLLKDTGFTVLKSKIYNELNGQKYNVMRDENWLYIIAQKEGSTGANYE